jgi:DNA-nicking Smr family endonuclease
MMRSPRGLSPEEAALWSRVAATIKPIRPRAAARTEPVVIAGMPVPKQPGVKGREPPPLAPVTAPVAAARPLDRHGLDGGWERKVTQGAVQPDFTIDLHGHSLHAAHDRLDHGLALALSQGARVVLVITGLPRPVDAADRAARRGAIRAKLLDWLAAGQHASKIAAVRPAHRKHGGAGAVYVVLRRAR